MKIEVERPYSVELATCTACSIGIDRQDRKEGAEDLLFSDAHGWADLREDGRCVECAPGMVVIAQWVAAQQELRTLDLADFGILMHGLDASHVDERPHVGLRIESIAHAQLFGGGHQPVGKGLLHGTLDNHTAGSCAALACRAERAAQDALGGQRQVGIFQHDDGVLAAQFQRAASQVAPADLRDASAQPPSSRSARSC